MVYVYQKYTFKTIENYYVISDEGTYKLGLVLLFRNGLYLPVCLKKKKKKKTLMLSPMKAFTN